MSQMMMKIKIRTENRFDKRLVSNNSIHFQNFEDQLKEHRFGQKKKQIISIMVFKQFLMFFQFLLFINLSCEY